jgi:hypothetical protein
MAETPPKELRFFYIKSPSFHGVHADGAFGGLTPHGDVHLAFFAERIPIPQEVVHTLDAAGEVSGEKERIGKEGVVRELQVDVTMKLDTAEALVKLILAQVDAMKKIEAIKKTKGTGGTTS